MTVSTNISLNKDETVPGDVVLDVDHLTVDHHPEPPE